LGFIVQQLPGRAGLRVGNVTDGCSAERAGVVIGDRIVAVDGKAVLVSNELTDILDHKSPGDLLTMDVTRDGASRRVGFLLSGEEQSVSDVARLSDKVVEAGQELTCIVSIPLPPDKHVYSMHRIGFGVPTQLEFRGGGFELVGPTEEPVPRKIVQADLEPMWVLDGTVELRQTIRITDPARFQLLLQVYAQVCDDHRCHEFRAILGNDGSDQAFFEFQGRFDRRPLVGPGGSS
jgi:hypothetical protein